MEPNEVEVLSPLSDSELLSWEEFLEKFIQRCLEPLEVAFKASNDGLTKEQFFTISSEQFPPEVDHSRFIISLYDSVKSQNISRIAWSNLLDFLTQNLRNNKRNGLSLQFQKFFHVPQTQRESIVKIVLIETNKYFCYVMVAKHGRVGIYDGTLNFLTSYQLITLREHINQGEEARRKRNIWVTDAIFSPDILMLIATSSARSVTIYEASGLQHVPMWLISGTPNIFQCICYKNSGNCPFLVFGDDQGWIVSVEFLQAKKTLLRKKFSDRVTPFYWQELSEEKEFLIIRYYKNYHSSAVKRIACSKNELISCIDNPIGSIVIRSFPSKGSCYTFNIKKGCRCFALTEDNKILITGSKDGLVKIWDAVVTSRPIAKLKRHKAPIIDIKIIDKLEVVLSCSSDGVLFLWNLKEQTCIQELKLDFPSFQILGKVVEWGLESIYFGPRDTTGDFWERSSVLITCCNQVAILKFFYNNGISTGEGRILPPPPLQNSVLIPNSWKILEHVDGFPKESLEKKNESLLDVAVEKRLEELKFILERNLFADGLLESNDINFKIAGLERKKLEMEENVARGAPYLAMELQEIEDLRLSPNLPIPNKPKIKNIVNRIKKMMEDASYRDTVFSESFLSRSSSSSRSTLIDLDS